jgi:DNA anti-recombination protein RmuC
MEKDNDDVYSKVNRNNLSYRVAQLEKQFGEHDKEDCGRIAQLDERMGKQGDLLTVVKNLLEVGQATWQEQIVGLKSRVHALSKDTAEDEEQLEIMRNRIDETLAATTGKFEAALAATNKKFEEMLESRNAALSSALAATNKKFDEALSATNTKFDENKNYFNRWFIGILATVITGLLVSVVVFLLSHHV